MTLLMIILMSVLKEICIFEAFQRKWVSTRKIHNRIQNKTILIIGFGGIGTIVVDNLQRMGFKNFILIDYDIVEPSNLNRQMFLMNNIMESLR